MKRVPIAVPFLLFVLLGQGAAQNVAGFGNFRFVEMQDEMGDAGSSYVYVMADYEMLTMGSSTGIGFVDRDPALVWLCADGGLSVIYRFDTPLAGDEGSVQVRYRMDDAAATEFVLWALNPGLQDEMADAVADTLLDMFGVLGDMMSGMGMSAHLPPETVASFTREAMGAGRVLLRVTDPFDGETHTDTFRMEGIADAMARLSCGG